MLDPFTIREGRLEMDDGRGIADGPRVIDPRGGLIRWRDERTIPLVGIRAVAVIWVERMMRVRVVRDWEMRSMMTHSVVLVPHKLPSDIDQVLDQLARTAGIPIAKPAAHVIGAMIDGIATAIFNGSALDARQTAKAIGRIAGLPVIELYGDQQLYRPAEALDLRIRDWMKLDRGVPRNDPGPPPPTAAIRLLNDQSASLVWTSGPPAGSGRLLYVLGTIGLFGALALSRTSPAVSVIAAAVSLATFAIAWKLGRPHARTERLLLHANQLVWKRIDREDAVGIDVLEMIRVDGRTLVLIDQEQETRIALPSPEAAEWMRAFLEYRLASMSANVPYR